MAGDLWRITDDLQYITTAEVGANFDHRRLRRRAGCAEIAEIASTWIDDQLEERATV